MEILENNFQYFGGCIPDVHDVTWCSYFSSSCCIQRKQKCAFTLPANTCYCRIVEAKVNKSKGTGLLGRSNEGAIEVSILTGCP